MGARIVIPGVSPGTVLLGKYRIFREIGAGGMGMVFGAEHLTLGTKVAIKVLLPEFAALPDASQRFVREAQAASRIVSEHVARVTDHGTIEFDGDAPAEGADRAQRRSHERVRALPYLVMEYLEGKDLHRYVKEGKRFSIEEAIDYVVQAAEALSQAHVIGIVHRDVKPANLFLTHRPDGAPLVKVLDFGISKVVEEAAQRDLQLTKTTAVMGSALYMSLEQMRSTKTVDHRTDIYALGVTLYELLSGTHPFTAESFSELCVKVSLDPPDPLRTHRPDVPEDLAEAIATAYARHPQDRYPTVGTFVSQLAPFATPETQAAIKAIAAYERSTSQTSVPMVRMLTPAQFPAVKVKRRPRVRWDLVIGGAGIAALLATVGFWWARGPAAPAASTASDAAAPPSAVAVPSALAALVPASASAPDPLVPPTASASPPPSASAPIAPSASASARPPRALPPECRRGEPFYKDSRGIFRPCR